MLGLLSLRPQTPYEITQQVRRSLDYCWPTPERSLYDQPERLVGLGLADVATDREGRRRYRITDAGRVALRRWLERASPMPRFHNEPLLRVLFADQGSVEDLHRVLGAVRAHVAERLELGLAQMEPYLDDDGLFQERAHVVTIVADLVSRLLGALDDWAAEVEQVSADWDTTQAVGLTPQVRAMLDRLIDDGRTRVAQHRDV